MYDSIRKVLTLVNNEQSMRLYYDVLMRAVDLSVHLIREIVSMVTFKIHLIIRYIRIIKNI